MRGCNHVGNERIKSPRRFTAFLQRPYPQRDEKRVHFRKDAQDAGFLSFDSYPYFTITRIFLRKMKFFFPLN